MLIVCLIVHRSTRWLSFRFVAPIRSRCINRFTVFTLCLHIAAAARIAGKFGIVDAARSGNASLVFLHLVADSSCVNCKFAKSGDTPLHLSAEQGHVEICRLLLQCNADVQAKNQL